MSQLPEASDAFYGQSIATPAGMLRVAKLPRCRKCVAVHPWARKPPVRVWECPECSFPIAAPEEKIVRLRLPGVLGWIADACYSIGQWLHRQAERLRK